MPAMASELGIDMSTKMNPGDRAATKAFLADMYAEFDKEYAAVEAEVGAPDSRNFQVYRELLASTAKVIREVNSALAHGILPW